MRPPQPLSLSLSLSRARRARPVSLAISLSHAHSLDRYFWGENTIWAAVILVDLVRPPFMMCAFNGTAGCPLQTCLMTREVRLSKRGVAADRSTAAAAAPADD